MDRDFLPFVKESYAANPLNINRDPGTEERTAIDGDEAGEMDVPIPESILERLAPYAVTTMDELISAISEYEGYVSDSPDDEEFKRMLDELVNAKNEILSLPSAEEPIPEEPTNDPFAPTVDPAALIFEDLNARLPSDIVTRADLTRSLSAKRRNQIRDPQNTKLKEEVDELEALIPKLTEYETLTQSKYNRNCLVASVCSAAEYPSSNSGTSTPHSSRFYQATPSKAASPKPSPSAPSSTPSSTPSSKTVSIDESDLKSRGNQSIREFEARIGDAKKIPPSAEGYLAQISTILALASKLNDMTVFDGLIPLAEELSTAVRDENLFNTSDDQQRLTKLNSALKSHDLRNAYELSQLLCSSVLSLNFMEVLRLALATHPATATLKDKENVVLFLGATGAGKSTLIKWAAGAVMVKSLVKTAEGHFIPHLHCVVPPGSPLESFSSSPSAISETRFVNVLELQLSDGRVFNLTDSPGLGDIQSAEVDIANSKGLADAMKGARDVRVVVVLGPVSTREEKRNFVQNLSTVSRLIPYPLEMSKSILFVLNNIPEETRPQMLDLIKELVLSLVRDKSVPSNSPLMNLFQLLIKQLEKDAWIADPLNQPCSELLDRISDLSPIDNPQDDFSYFVTQQSSTLLAKQLEYDRSSITYALNTSPMKVPFIAFKMGLLKRLMLETNMAEFASTYSDALANINRHREKLREKAFEQLSNALQHDNINEYDVNQFVASAEEMFNLEMALTVPNEGVFHLDPKSVYHKALFSKLEDTAERLEDQIRSSQHPFDISVSNDFLKLSMLHRIVGEHPKFPLINRSFLIARDHVCKSFTDAVSTCRYVHWNSDLELVVNLLDGLKSFVVPASLEPTKLDALGSAQSWVIRMFEDAARETASWQTFRAFDAPQESLTTAKEFISSLGRMQQSTILARFSNHVDRSIIDASVNGIVNNMVVYFITCCDYIKNCIPSFDNIVPVIVDGVSQDCASEPISNLSGDGDFSSLESHVKDLQELKTFPGLCDRPEVFQHFQQVLKALFHCLNKAQAMAMQLISVCFQARPVETREIDSFLVEDADRVSTQRLRLVMNVLSGARWLSAYQREAAMLANGPERVAENVKVQLLNYADLLSTRLRREAPKMSLNDCSSLSKYMVYLIRLNTVAELSDLIPELGPKIHGLNCWFHDLTQSSVNEICGMIQKDGRTEIERYIADARNHRARYEELKSKFSIENQKLLNSEHGPFSRLSQLQERIQSLQVEISSLSAKESEIGEKHRTIVGHKKDVVAHFETMEFQNPAQAVRELQQRTNGKYSDCKLYAADLESQIEVLKKDKLAASEKLLTAKQLLISLKTLEEEVRKAMEDPQIPQEAVDFLKGIDPSSLLPEWRIALNSFSDLESYQRRLDQGRVTIEARQLKFEFSDAPLEKLLQGIRFLACYPDAGLPPDTIQLVADANLSFQTFIDNYTEHTYEKMVLYFNQILDENPPASPSLRSSDSVSSAALESKLTKGSLIATQLRNLSFLADDMNQPRAQKYIKSFRDALEGHHRKIQEKLKRDEIQSADTRVLLEIVEAVANFEIEFKTAFRPTWDDIYNKAANANMSESKSLIADVRGHLSNSDLAAADRELARLTPSSLSIATNQLSPYFESVLNKILRNMNSTIISWTFSNIQTNAIALKADLDRIKDFEEGSALKLIISKSYRQRLTEMLDEAHTKIKDRISTFIQEFKSHHRDVKGTQNKLEEFETACNLLVSYSSDLVVPTEIEKVRKTVQSAANEIIDQAKTRSPTQWLIVPPATEAALLSHDKASEAEYYRVLDDNLKGWISFIQTGEPLLRAISHPPMDKSLIHTVYNGLGSTYIKLSQPEDVWPCYLLCKAAGATTLRYVDDVFAPLSSSVLLQLDAQSITTISGMLRTGAHVRLTTSQISQIAALTAYKPPNIRSRMLHELKHAITYLPEKLAKPSEKSTEDVEKRLLQATSELETAAKDFVLQGNSKKYESIVQQLEQDGHTSALSNLNASLIHEFESAAERLGTLLTRCNEGLKTNSTTGGPLLPLSELTKIHFLNEIKICGYVSTDSIRSNFRDACELIFSAFGRVLKSDTSLSYAFTLYTDLYQSQDQHKSAITTFLGLDTASITKPLQTCAAIFKSSKLNFESSLNSLANLETTNPDQVFSTLLEMMCLKKNRDSLHPVLKKCKDPVLLDAIESWVPPEDGMKRLLEMANNLHQQSQEIIQGLPESEFIEDVEKRHAYWFSLLQRMHIHSNIMQTILSRSDLPSVPGLPNRPSLKLADSLADFFETSSQEHIQSIEQRDLSRVSATRVSQFAFLIKDLVTHKRLSLCRDISTSNGNLFSGLQGVRKKLMDALSAKRISLVESIDWSNEFTLLEHACKVLCELMSMSSMFPVIYHELHQNGEEILSKVATRQNGLFLLRPLLLKSVEGNHVINTFPIFEGEQTYRWNQATLNITDEEATKALLASEFLQDPFNPSSEIDSEVRQNLVEKMSKRVARYEDTYNEVLQSNLTPDADISQLIPKCMKLAKSIKDGASIIERLFKSKSYTTYIPDLVGHVFTIWTLKRAHFYFQARGSRASRPESLDKYLQKPKPSQVIAILRLLGSGDLDEGKKAAFRNQLIQIKTGEGKSVTLAVAASILALLGYHVDVACYSEYMSQRDFLAFKDFFITLGVEKNVTYGTFAFLCERLLNSEFDIRSRAKSIVIGEPVQALPKESKVPPRILLIDEVDVFFSRSFYGSFFIPETNIVDVTVSDLVKEIWSMFEQTGKAPTLHQTKSSLSYQACIDRFPAMTHLLSDAVLFMLSALEDFNHPAPRVVSDRIGYAELDGTISFNVSYGYKTMWAYFSEHKKGVISKEALEGAISIAIHCGHFSYSEIPHLYSAIMGVSGTLSDMSTAERNILKQYGISRLAYIPSIYGDSKATWVPNDHTHVISRQPNDTDETHKSEFFVTIAREIQSEMNDDVDKPGAVLVFFENDQIMQEFMSSPHGVTKFPNSRRLDPNTDTLTKDMMVRDSTCSGNITYMNRSLGRGTDFICVDPLVVKRGGVKVIQTFLSKEKSEETQIRGRTGRQGQPGRYCMVLSSDQLATLDITDKMLADAVSGSKKYAMLDEARNAFFLREYQRNQNQIDFAKAEHVHSEAFLKHLRAGEVQEVLKYIELQNRAPFSPSPAKRVLVLIDATNSMDSCINQTKNTIGQTFFRLAEVLTEAGLDSGCFELQFAAYRNYNAPPDSLLETSGWEKTPKNLEQWLSCIQATYGWVDEAIEVGLQFANQLAIEPTGLSQIVIIGDAGPNPPEHIPVKRKDHDWTGTRFETPTTTDQEIAKLVKNTGDATPVHIPISCFAVKKKGSGVEPKAEAKFKEIAALTGGAYDVLDVYSETAAEHLTRILSEQILKAVSQDQATADKLIAIYKSRDWKTHRASSS